MNPWINNEVKKEIKRCCTLQQTKMRQNNPKSMGHSENSPQREIHMLRIYLKKQEKSQINNLTLQLKELEKDKQTKPKVSRGKEIIKITADINSA